MRENNCISIHPLEMLKMDMFGVEMGHNQQNKKTSVVKRPQLHKDLRMHCSKETLQIWDAIISACHQNRRGERVHSE
jgi:hypothetical protein